MCAVGLKCVVISTTPIATLKHLLYFQANRSRIFDVYLDDVEDECHQG